MRFESLIQSDYDIIVTILTSAFTLSSSVPCREPSADVVPHAIDAVPQDVDTTVAVKTDTDTLSVLAAVDGDNTAKV